MRFFIDTRIYRYNIEKQFILASSFQVACRLLLSPSRQFFLSDDIFLILLRKLDIRCLRWAAEEACRVSCIAYYAPLDAALLAVVSLHVTLLYSMPPVRPGLYTSSPSRQNRAHATRFRRRYAHWERTDTLDFSAEPCFHISDTAFCDIFGQRRHISHAPDIASVSYCFPA